MQSFADLVNCIGGWRESRTPKAVSNSAVFKTVFVTNRFAHPINKIMSDQYYYKLKSNDMEFSNWLQDFYVSDNIVDKFKSYQPHTTYYINPDLIRDFEIFKTLKSFGFIIDNCKFFRCRAKFGGLPHIDGVPPRHSAINFPVMNCEEGYQVWYKNQPKYIEKVNSDLRIILPIETNISWIEGEKMYLDRPTLVNVGIWHAVNNSNNNHHRYVFSVRFEGNPTYEDVLKVLQNNNI